MICLRSHRKLVAKQVIHSPSSQVTTLIIDLTIDLYFLLCFHPSPTPALFLWKLHKLPCKTVSFEFDMVVLSSLIQEHNPAKYNRSTYAFCKLWSVQSSFTQNEVTEKLFPLCTHKKSFLYSFMHWEILKALINKISHVGSTKWAQDFMETCPVFPDAAPLLINKTHVSYFLEYYKYHICHKSCVPASLCYFQSLHYQRGNKASVVFC